MYPSFRKSAAIGFLLFLALWVAGTIRASVLPYPPPTEYPLLVSSPDMSRGQHPMNAWANNLKEIGMAQTPLPVLVDQPDVDKILVFEKKADLALSTAAFDEDEAAIRTAITTYKAVLFTEKKSGIAPARRLLLEIGVHPEKFDGLLAMIRQQGHLEALDVQQQDRTGEFRRLNAQRQSLKKYLESILVLRGAAKVSIDDSLRLEQRIQDIEKELQNLGVNLGDLLSKESFYHIHVSLVEHQPGDRLDHTFTLPRQIFNGFVWALGWWFASFLGVAVLVGTVLSVQTLLSKGAFIGMR